MTGLIDLHARQNLTIYFCLVVWLKKVFNIISWGKFGDDKDVIEKTLHQRIFRGLIYSYMGCFDIIIRKIPKPFLFDQ